MGDLSRFQKRISLVLPLVWCLLNSLVLIFSYISEFLLKLHLGRLTTSHGLPINLQTSPGAAYGYVVFCIRAMHVNTVT